jgi:hypothetical protein
MDRNRTVHGRSSAQIVIGRQIASTTKDAPLSILSSTTRTRSIQSIWSSKGIIGQITPRLRSRLLLLSYGHCCHDHRHSSQSLLPLVLLVHLLLLLVRGAAKTSPCERPTPVARTSTMLLPPPSQFFGSTSVLLPPPTSPVPDDATRRWARGWLIAETAVSQKRSTTVPASCTYVLIHEAWPDLSLWPWHPLFHGLTRSPARRAGWPLCIVRHHGDWNSRLFGSATLPENRWCPRTEPGHRSSKADDRSIDRSQAHVTPI